MYNYALQISNHYSQVVKVPSCELTTSKYAIMHNSSVRGVADMASLADLHEGAILNNLKIRYFANEIYVRFSIGTSVHPITR